MKISLLTSILALNMFCNLALAESPEVVAFRNQAVKDSELIMSAHGAYSESLDGVITFKGQHCKLGREIQLSEFKFPIEASDSASFSILTGSGAADQLIPSAKVYIYSSGKYSRVTGAKGFAKRTVIDSNTVSYSEPKMSFSDASCGSIGHMSKPVRYTSTQFLIGINSVELVTKYKCGFFSSQEHTIVKTCQF